MLDNVQETSSNWSAKSHSEQLALEFVGDPEAKGHLVKAELFFEHKVVVVRQRKLNDSGDEVVEEEEQQRLGDFARHAGRNILDHEDADERPHVRIHIVVDFEKLANGTVDGRDE